jgi:hypothetical protein
MTLVDDWAKGEGTGPGISDKGSQPPLAGRQ